MQSLPGHHAAQVVGGHMAVTPMTWRTPCGEPGAQAEGGLLTAWKGTRKCRSLAVTGGFSGEPHMGGVTGGRGLGDEAVSLLVALQEEI